MPPDLTREQKLYVLTADPDTGELVPAPEWLSEECHNLGLVTPGDRSGAWKLSPAGREVWRNLNTDL